MRLYFLLLLLLVIGGIGVYIGLPLWRAEYHFRAATKAQARRDFALARSHLAANLTADPRSARDHFLLARVARQSGAFDEADDVLNQCERLEGQTERIALERALVQAQQGAMTPLQERHLQLHVAQGHPDALQILEALSVGCLVSYQFGRAHGYLSEWIDREPGNFRPYLWRSMAEERRQDLPAALEDARRAADLSPTRFEAQLRLGEALLLNAENEEAAQVFDRLYQQHPDDLAVALALAQSLQKLSRVPEAARLLDAVLARLPNDTSAILERSRLALQMNEVALAYALLQKGVKLAPWDYVMQYTLLQCLKQQGKDTRAVEARLRRMEEDQAPLKDLNEKINRNPTDLALRCEIARIYLEAQNSKEALNWLKSVVKMDPSHPLANQMLVDYYEKAGQPALAAPYRAALAGSAR
jgi:tetratricopeptide (TPR) repeat protein